MSGLPGILLVDGALSQSERMRSAERGRRPHEVGTLSSRALPIEGALSPNNCSAFQGLGI